MLSTEDNEILTRTGPGTPLGTLLRRFWAPALLSDELPEPDGPPVRVQLLGEKFVAFRDTDGRVGLLDRYCPHRRASLFWGRNEDHGLRCIYHGWKFDVDGKCADLPNCPEGVNLKDRVRTGAYPTVERGGIVWAYLGPHDRKPAFPDVEILNAPASHRHILKIHVRANYLQAQEGDVDLGHTSFLHSRIDNMQSTGMAFLHTSGNAPPVFHDRVPKYFVRETDYGLMHAVRRIAGEGEYSWRVGQYLMPYIVLVPGRTKGLLLTNIRVPIDDESSFFYRLFVHLERPLNDDDRPALFGGVMAPEMISGTTTMKANKDNDYLIDRGAQRTKTYSGITSIVAQDAAMTEDQDGSIMDRTREYLVSSDRTIIALRKKLLARVKALAQGTEPPEASRPHAYAVRPADVHSPEEGDIDEALALR